MNETAKNAQKFLNAGGVNDGGTCPNCFWPVDNGGVVAWPLSLLPDSDSPTGLAWKCTNCGYKKPVNPTFIRLVREQDKGG
jgi:hypothetical protein